MRKGGEHEGVVVLEFREFVLESYNLEALATDLASVDWAFPYKIEHFLMSI